MLSAELEEKLRLVDMSIEIQKSDAPRITAVRILPTRKMKILFLINDIGAEFGALLVTVVWALAVSMPEQFILGLSTYQALLLEASGQFWALCWWLLAVTKFIAIITGNPYIRKTSFALGLLMWSATTGLLILGYGRYNILVGLSTAFAITALWNYAKAGLVLDQRNSIRTSEAAKSDEAMELPDGFE